MKTGNFRKNFFGGFNREDVTKYVVKLAEERNEYKERAEKAEEELASRDAAAAEARIETVPEEPEIAEVIPEAAGKPEELDIEKTLTEIRESVAAVNAGIQESVASIRGELQKPDDAEVRTPLAPVPAEQKQAVDTVVSDRINRVLGMLECTESHFALLEKTLRAIKSDVEDV